MVSRALVLADEADGIVVDHHVVLHTQPVAHEGGHAAVLRVAQGVNLHEFHVAQPRAGGLGQSQAVAGGGAHVRGGHRFGHALVVLHGELRVAGIAARGEHHGLSAHFHGLAGGRTGAAHAYDRAAFHDELFDLRIGVQGEVARGLGGVHQAGDVVAAALLALALDLDRVPALPQAAMAVKTSFS